MINNHLELFITKRESDVETFWKLFDSYINELSLNTSFGDDFDLEYYYSDEYRGAIEKLRTRYTNPLNILLILNEGITIGFLMYVTYFDEGGKCFLMEYYIEPNFRNIGHGKSVYSMAEKYIYEEGAKYIELTPTNEANERFWRSMGLTKSTDMDEDNKYYYRKPLEC